MKTRINIALRALLSISLFVLALPISAASPPQPTSMTSFSSGQERERRHVKQGPEVGKRVKELQKFNKNVRRGLADFEKNARRNGHRPKLDESFSITIDPTNRTQSSAALKRPSVSGRPFRKTSLRVQDPDYSGYGVEMIFIPTYSIPGEWQGTVVFNRFDPSGAYLGQYVADVAMAPDPTGTFWDVFFEVSYEGGEAYLEYGNPDFELGTPTSLQDPAMLQPPIAGIPRPIFQKASFAAVPQRFGPRVGIPTTPRMRWVMKCTAIGSAGGAVGCGAVSLIWGGIPFLPCAVGGATTALTVCTLTAIFGD